MSFKATRSWLKDNWFFLALVVLLFLAAVVERGPIEGVWFASTMCYVIALFWFFSVAVPAIFLRTRLSWLEWSLLGVAGAFVLLAFALDFRELIPVGAYGLVSGIVLGLFLSFFAWRQRAQ